MKGWTKCLIVFLILFSAAARQPVFGESEIFDRLGVISKHGMHGAVPEENIDLFTGNLTLKFKDIVLPGPGGFDLIIWRVYNSKIYRDHYPGQGSPMQQNPYSWVGLGWSMHMGRVHIGDPEEHVIEFSDGRWETAYPNLSDDGYMTKDFSKYDMGNKKLYFKDGTVWTFGEQRTIYYDMTNSSVVLQVTEIENPLGHKIQVSYHPSFPVMTSITDSMGRVINFEIDDSVGGRPKLTEIRVRDCDGGTVVYRYDVERFSPTYYHKLVSYKPPEIPASTYEYYSKSTPSEFAIKKLTTSFGGSMEYEYDDHDFYFFGICLYTRVLKNKTIKFTSSDPARTWRYNYPNYKNGDDTVTVNGPEFDTYATYLGYPESDTETHENAWKIGLLKKKWFTENNSSEVIYSEEMTWVSQLLSKNYWSILQYNYGWIRAPLLVKVIKTTKGDADVTVEYWYGDEINGASRNYHKYGLLTDTVTSYNGEIEKCERYFYRFEDEGPDYKPFTDRYMLNYMTKKTIYDIRLGEVGGIWDRYWFTIDETKTEYYDIHTEDNFSRVKQVSRWRSGIGDYLTWTYDYNEPHPSDLTKTVDLPGSAGTETYKYSYGVLSEFKRPGYSSPELSRSISQYNSAVKSETNQFGGTMVFNYDDLGRITSVNMPSGFNDITVDWSTNSAAVKQGGNTITKYWDGMGRDTGYKESGDGISLYFRKTLDAEGRVISESKGSTNVSDKYIYSLNAIGNPKKITDPTGKATTISYSGEQRIVTDANLNQITLKYENLPGLVTGITDANNKIGEYTYDDLGRLLTAKYNNSRSQEFIYNGLGQLFSEKHPETGGIFYDYDDEGNLELRVQNGSYIAYDYNSANQLKQTDSWNGEADDPLKETVIYEYDLTNGAVKDITSSRGWSRTGITYSSLGAIKSENQLIPGLGNKNLTYTYDKNNNLASITLPGGRVVSYDNNTLNMPELLSFNNGKKLVSQVNYGYNKQPVSMAIGNGTGFTASYNPKGLLETSSLTKVSRLFNAVYGYDDVGNITSITGTIPTIDVEFEYDDLYRLTDANFAGGKTYNYTYDDYGNLTHADDGLSFSDWTYNEQNRITNSGYNYDSRGNLISKPNCNYFWDSLNRLIRVYGYNEFTYNERGLRLSAGHQYAAKNLTVTFPNGGENLEVNQLYNIYWSVTGVISNVKIEYSIDGGLSYSTIVDATPNTGSYGWVVPDAVSANCLVRISETDGYPTDVSDGVFSISLDGEPTISITSPAVGEKLAVSSYYNIAWQSTSGVGDVKIEYSYDNGSNYSTIVDSTENNGSYLWTIPGTESPNCLLRISDVDGDPVDISDTFIIYRDRFDNTITGPIVTDGGDSRSGSWGDYNSDGEPDLFAANNGYNFLYANDGAGNLTKIDNHPIVADSGDSYSGAWGDYDNDGDRDLFVADFVDSNSLYRNIGGGNFEKVTIAAFSADTTGSISGAWGDYDNDGHLDLFVANYNRNNSLYRNNGQGDFVKIETGAIVTGGGASRKGEWIDFDHDGDLDLFVANSDNENNFLYENDGSGNFSVVNDDPVVSDAGNSQGFSWGDYDNDGDFDLFVANDGSQCNFLYQNNGDEPFSKVLSGPVVADFGNSRDGSWADFDNDGDLDLIVTNRNGKNFLYLNNGDATFSRVTSGPIVSLTGNSEGCAWEDYDKNGSIDLFIARSDDENNSFYVNNGNSNKWLNITCEGAISNKFAVGAKVWVKAQIGGEIVWQLRQVSGTPGRSLSAAFGLGDAAVIEEIRVEFPSGSSKVLTGISSNQFLTILESTASQDSDINIKQDIANIPDGGTFDFGQVLVGSTKDVVFTIENTGTSDLLLNPISPIEISGHNAAEFSIISEPDTVVFPGENTSFTLRFTPTGADDKTANIAINSNDADENPYDISITAAAYSASYITVTSPAGGDFWCQSETQTITWEKVGTMDENVKIILCRDDTAVLDIIDPTANDGEFEWAIPGTIEPDQYTIKVQTIDELVSGSSPVFTIAAPQAGVEFTELTTGPIYQYGSNSWGASWGDYDNDGFPDLFVTNATLTYEFENFLFRNNGAGNFDRIQEEPFMSSTRSSFSGSWGDYDNDGNMDLYVANDSPDYLYHNNGDGTFTEVTSGGVGTESGNSHGCAWVDYDRDGYLDLFVCIKNNNNRLYRNKGEPDFEFEKITTGDMVNDIGNSQGCAWADYTNDGWPDLFVANLYGRDFLYRNNGDGTFTKITNAPMVTAIGNSQGGSWGDYDNDGDLDLFVTNSSENNCLYRNNGYEYDYSFTKMTSGIIVSDGGNSFSSAWGDYDNDGDIDLIVANCDGANFLYRNSGEGGFRKITTTLVAEDSERSMSCSWADYDRNGFLDLMVANDYYNRNSLYTNHGNDNNWIQIKCEGVKANRTAIGTRVELTAVVNGEQLTQIREISGQTGSKAQNSLIVEFGLGDAAIIDEIKIKWPSGNIQTLSGVAPNQYLTIQENVSAAEINVRQDAVDIPDSSSYDYGAVQVGSYKDVVFTIENQGTEDLILDNSSPVEITGTHAAEFSLIQQPGTLIPAGGNTTFSLRFTPASEGEKSAGIAIANNDGDENPYNFDLTAAGYLTGYINVISPGNGETWTREQTYTISWEKIGALDANVKIFLYLESTAVLIIADTTDNDGSFDWTIPLTVQPDDYTIKVQTVGEAVSGLSGLFSIAAAAPADQFSKVIAGPVVTDEGSSRGGSWADYDNDGLIDLFVPNDGDNYLYKNLGSGNFEKIIEGPVVTGGGNSFGGTWGDYDNDGYIDLFVPNYNENNVLYKNLGNGSFSKIENVNIVTDGGASFAATWGDYDGDGLLDLFVANHAQNNFLYHNEGSGVFIRVTAGPVVSGIGASRQSTWVDYDRNGTLDLLVTNADSQQNVLYENDGDGIFVSIPDGPVVTDTGYSLGNSWGDYDNNGYLDLFVANYNESNGLYKNMGDGNFTKITSGDIVNEGEASFGSSWIDYDNDGDLDLFVTDRDNNNDLYRNNGDTTFTKITDSVIVTDIEASWGCAWADYDNDGDSDLFVANNGTNNSLYRNNGTANNWIKIQCEGVLSNTSAVGTKVEVEANIGGTTYRQLREISGQTGYSSQDSLTATFGLGDATIIDEVRVQWPSGTIQTLTDVAPNRLLTVREHVSEAEINVKQDTTVIQDGGSFDCGQLQLGSAKDIIFTIENIGFEDLILTGTPLVGISGTNAAEFSVVQDPVTPVILGSSTTFTIRFTPAAEGTKNAEIIIESNDVDENPYHIFLTAVAYSQPAINVTSPVNGDSWFQENSYTILWDKLGAMDDNVKIHLCENSSEILEIAGYTSNDGSYDWPIPTIVLPGQYTIKVRTVDNAVTGSSNPFSILESDRFLKVNTGDIVTGGGVSRGGSWADYDNDGLIDLFVPNEGNNFLYKNLGDGNFEKIIDSPVTAGGGNSFAGTWGDFDNDGYIDLFVANYDENNFLYKNLGNGLFEKIENRNIVTDGGASFGATWGDYDGDGRLDLFVANHVEHNFLYHNDGSGNFSRVSSDPVVIQGGASRQGSWVDYDGNGHPDLFVANADNQYNFLYQNNGAGGFAAVGNEPPVADSGYSLGNSWGDFNNDGNLDLFVANYNQNNFFYENTGGGHFNKITAGDIVSDGGHSFGSSWVDYDNDGDLDLFAANREDVNCLYRNNGDNTFTKITDSIIVTDNQAHWGCAWADYDNDGDLDLFIASSEGNNSLYRNKGCANNWIKIKCKGVASNTSAIGAKVKVLANISGTPGWQLREISSQTGYSGQDSPAAEFGLGSAAIIDEIRIEWPSGIVQTLNNISANQALTITEESFAGITLTSPNGGESLTAGSIHNITWTCAGVVGNIKIEYSIDNGANWDEITPGTPNTGSYDWTIPASPSSDCLIRVSEIDGDPTDMSDAVFSILLPPTITLTSPNGGESYAAGSIHTLTWTSTGILDNVKIEYSTDNGALYTTITGSAANTGSFPWTVPGEVSPDCLIRIGDTDGDPADGSDAVFSIVSDNYDCGETWFSADYSGSHTFRAVTFGDSKFAAVGEGGVILTSVDGLVWNTGSSGTAANLNGIAYGAGKFAAAGVDGTIITSSDGLTWTPGASGTGETLNALTYGQNTFLTVGTNGTILTSSDGLTWTMQPSNTTKELQALCYGDNKFVAVGTDGIILVSADGENWDNTSPGRKNSLSGITYGDHLFVAVGAAGAILISSDGITWQNATSGTTTQLNSIGFGNATYIVTGENGTILKSNDGFTYESHETGISGHLYGAAYGAGNTQRFVSAGMGTIIYSTCNYVDPTIAVTSPNGGESWQAGTFHPITWTGSGITGDVTVEYSLNNGTSWTAITSGAANSGSYNWAVPYQVSSDCLIRISEADGDPTDVSDNVFFITAANAVLTLTYPNGGEILMPGSTEAITWESTGDIGDITIDYSSDNGSTWTTIVSTTANDGSYDWLVPGTFSGEYLIMVREASGDLGPNDVSDAVFSIAQVSATIRVISPNGGESLTANQGHYITWFAAGEVGDVKIEYTTNSGDTWTEIIAITVNDGIFPWAVPDEVSTACLIRISDIDGDPVDVSDGVFSIEPGSSSNTMTLTSPNGGESLEVGTVHEITWERSATAANDAMKRLTSQEELRSKTSFSSNNSPYRSATAANDAPEPYSSQNKSPHENMISTNNSIDTILIKYSLNNGSNWLTVAEATENDGSFDWTIPDTPATECLVKISQSDDDFSPNDVSDGVFSITPAVVSSLTLTSPNGGESLTAGSTHNITWTDTGTVGVVRLEYSIDSGTSWTAIIDPTENDGSYQWTVPDTPSDNCLVRISEARKDDGPRDQSDAVFSIVSSVTQTITITSPNGGETLHAGATHKITWNSAGTVGDVKIELSTDNGTSWSDIAAATTNNGAYNWVVPDTASDTCLVRISESDGEPADVSDAVFSIAGYVEPTIMITFPNGGESITAGSIQPITWISTGIIELITIEYSTDDGTNWTGISDGTGDSGSYDWTVPDTPSENCKIRLSDSTGAGTADESDAVFSIVEAGTAITVTNPAGGETLAIGGPISIEWQTTGISGDVEILLKRSDDSEVFTIEPACPYDGSPYEGIIPEDAEPGQYVIEVRQGSVTGRSADFVLTETLPPSLTVTAPVTGEKWYRGITHLITWTRSEDIASNNVRIDLFDAADAVLTIETSTDNDGFYKWTVAEDLETGNYTICVKVVGEDISSFSSEFSIDEETPLVVTSPRSGVEWYRNVPHLITWHRDEEIAGTSAAIYLYDETGANIIKTIATTVENSGSYEWTVDDDIPDGNYFIRIETIDLLNSNDSGIFTIAGPGNLVVTVPYGCEEWQLEETRNINWYRDDDIASVNVAISLYNGTGTQKIIDIATTTENDGLFEWFMGSDIDPGDYVIKITTVDETEEDLSNVFSIALPQGSAMSVSAADENVFASGSIESNKSFWACGACTLFAPDWNSESTATLTTQILYPKRYPTHLGLFTKRSRWLQTNTPRPFGAPLSRGEYWQTSQGTIKNSPPSEGWLRSRRGGLEQKKFVSLANFHEVLVKRWAAGGKDESNSDSEKNNKIGYNSAMEEIRRQHSELITKPKEKNIQKTGFEVQQTAPDSPIKDSRYFNNYYIPFLSSDSYEINQEAPVTTGGSERVLHIPTDKITRDSPGTRKTKQPPVKKPAKTAAQTNTGRTLTATTTYYIWSFDGRLMAEYDQTGACTREYIYLGNTLLAEYHPSTGKYYYQFQDQVNSTRLVTDDDGNVVYSATYGPYGDIQKEWVNTYQPKQKYSGKERDSYTDLDYFGARYYDNKSFRFISVDPVKNREEAIINPQLWNLYSYCRNNPITYYDPDGRNPGAGALALKMWTCPIPGSRIIAAAVTAGLIIYAITSNDSSKTKQRAESIARGENILSRVRKGIRKKTDRHISKEHKRRLKESNKYEPPKNSKDKTPPPVSPRTEQQLKREPWWASIIRIITSITGGSH